MKFLLKKVSHLSRYFLLLGILAFFAYVMRLGENVTVLFMGPPLYLAHGLKHLVDSKVIRLPSSPAVNFYGFLLPITLLYFGLIGFQLKQLWNERGIIRTISLIVFIVFLAYIHFTAWKNLLVYLTPAA